jgi:riboflavin transporter FmnP
MNVRMHSYEHTHIPPWSVTFSTRPKAFHSKIDKMIKFSAKEITLTALFITLGVILPIIFHQFALGGRIFSPMHIPVFLAGIFVGPVGGLIVGLACPTLSFLLTGMPPPYAVPLMSVELPVYGVSIGLLIRWIKLPILSLLISMILGRLAFGLGLFVLGQFLSLPYGFEAFIKVSVITGLPGITIQLILIPLLIETIQLAKR